VFSVITALFIPGYGAARTLRRFVLRPASEHNVVRILFSLVQAMAGGITIYRAQGDQITRYGYSAFGLSVVPYVFMSIMNILASLLGSRVRRYVPCSNPRHGQGRERWGKI